MIEKYFKAAHVLRWLRSSVVDDYLDGFADYLAKSGFQPWTIRGHLRGAAHLGHWSSKHAFSIEQLEEGLLEAFFDHLPTCPISRPNEGKFRSVKAGAQHFLAYLRKVGVVPQMIEESTDQSPLLDGFCLWMRCHRGVRESTLDLYLPLIRDFLSEVGEEPGLYDADGVRAAILSRAKCCGLARVRSIGTAVRMFLRYLATQGLCSPSLAYAIPAQAHWRLSSLPRYLPAQDVTQVVDACDPATRKGARDRAIVLLLARLGLRAGDIADLRISDIDWKGARLRVMGKSRRETWLPLPQGAGDAVLHYLEIARPVTDDDHVFLRVKPPFDSFSGSSAVSKVVASAIKRSGVSAPSMGAHLLRHSAATEMLRQGASLDMIGTVLIHNSVETTLLYAKVDVERLQMIAQPWPDQEVTSC